MTILIIGGLGFIGSFIARKLLKQGYDVVLADVTFNEKLIKDIRSRVAVVKGDVTDSAQLIDILKKYKPEVVFHYAALLSTAVESNPALGYKVNFEGLWNTYEAARIADVGAIIFASSVAAYGLGIPKVVKEDTYSIPQTLYGISKQLGEMLGLWFDRKYGIQFAALRYASVIGPGRRDGGASSYSSLIIQKAAQEEQCEVNVAEDATIPIVYVKDAADAAVTVYKKMKELKTKIYNVASLYPSPTAEEIANMVRKIVPEAKIAFKPDPLVTTIVNSWPKNITIEKIREEAKWSPKYNKLELIVSDFINEVKRNPEMYFI